MSINEFTPLTLLCTHYEIEMTFFSNLGELGLIEINTVDQVLCIREDDVPTVEKMIRLHHDLNVNLEGIDVVFNLLGKIDELQTEVVSLRNRLRIHED